MSKHQVLGKIVLVLLAGLSINILLTGQKSPKQADFFKNSAANISPASRFLGRLYTFCNFANYTFFNVSINDM